MAPAEVVVQPAVATAPEDEPAPYDINDYGKAAKEIAQVLRDLYLLRSGKTLSYGEKRMLNTAIDLLAQEIAVAKGQKASQAHDEIIESFGDVGAVGGA